MTMPTYLRKWTSNSPQAGNPQHVLLSQGMTRPGIVSGQHWGPQHQRVEQMVRLNGVGPWVPASGVFVVRPTPARRPNPALSNPEMR